MGVVKSSLQTWHCSADSREDNDDRGVPTQSVGSGTSPFEGIFIEAADAKSWSRSSENRRDFAMERSGPRSEGRPLVYVTVVW